MTDYQFINQVNNGYKIVEEYPHQDGTFTVLGIHDYRTFHRYVVWSAEIRHGQRVFWNGIYHTEIMAAAGEFTRRTS